MQGFARSGIALRLETQSRCVSILDIKEKMLSILVIAMLIVVVIGPLPQVMFNGIARYLVFPCLKAPDPFVVRSTTRSQSMSGVRRLGEYRSFEGGKVTAIIGDIFHKVAARGAISIVQIWSTGA